MARFFIIGNGFDIAHGYPTRYSDFRDWCKEKLENIGLSLDMIPNIPFSIVGHHGEEVFDEKDSIKLLMWLLSKESLQRNDSEWNGFEEYLHELDLQMVMDENAQFVYADLANDPHDNALSHEEQDLQMYAQALQSAVQQINVVFSEWIREVSITDRKIPFGERIICNNEEGVDRNDLFLNFNYTETLEKSYGVPENHICYIHGNRNHGDELIIGHGDDSDRNFYNRSAIATDILEATIRSLQKDTWHIIQENWEFWEELCRANITEVYSFGFGYGDVDMEYIREIVHMIPKISTWYLYDYSADKNKEYERKIRDIGFEGDFGRIK